MRDISLPEISVVMSVFNDADHLKDSVESILYQEGVTFEFIIVNDGSTDDSADKLDEYARLDNRIRIIHQNNQGLTKALIRGCSEAKGNYIARQDANDISLPGRLKKQLDSFKKHSDAVLVTCGTRYVDPDGEYLYDVVQSSESLMNSLNSLDINTIFGPSHHGSVMIKKSEYIKTGYRSQFYFAQDLDLWMRLAERRQVVAIPEVLYVASYAIDTISGLNRNEQRKMKKIIVECSRLRRNGLDEGVALKKAFNLSSQKKKVLLRLKKAQASYFIGACLLKNRNFRAKGYFINAIRYWPFHLKSWFRLIVG